MWAEEWTWSRAFRFKEDGQCRICVLSLGAKWWISGLLTAGASVFLSFLMEEPTSGCTAELGRSLFTPMVLQWKRLGNLNWYIIVRFHTTLCCVCSFLYLWVAARRSDMIFPSLGLSKDTILDFCKDSAPELKCLLSFWVKLEASSFELWQNPKASLIMHGILIKLARDKKLTATNSHTIR